MFITCPVCGFTMSEYNVSDDSKSTENSKVLQNIQLCHMCGSIWIDGRYLEQVLALAELPENIDITEIFAEQDTLIKEGERVCPECYSPLYITSRGLVSIDQCNSCRGILFDREELREVWANKKSPNKKELNKIQSSYSSQSTYKSPKTQKNTVSKLPNIVASPKVDAIANIQNQTQNIDINNIKPNYLTQKPKDEALKILQNISKELKNQMQTKVSKDPNTKWAEFETWYAKQFKQ